MLRENSIRGLNRRIAVGASALSLAALLISATVSAQQLPNAGQELERQQERRPEPPTFPSAIITPSKSASEVADEGPLIPVNAFLFTGELSVFPESLLQAQVADAIGTALSLKALKKVLERIKTLYSKNGYFLSQVITPPQDVTEGAIRVEIFEGRRDELPQGTLIKGEDLRINPDRLKAIIDTALPPNQPMQELSLERGMLLISDLPGVKAKVSLEPGSKTGTTRLLLDVKESPIVVVRAGGDNAGGRLLGATRLNLGLELNNPTGRGEQFIANAAKSLGTGKMNYLSLEYSQPVGSRGLRLGINYSYLNYDVGKEFTSLDASGSGRAWSFDATYPLIRSRLSNLTLQGGLDYKSLESTTSGITTSGSEVAAGRIGLNASHVDEFWSGGITEVGMTLHRGDFDLSKVAAGLAMDQAANGPHTHGKYSKMRWYLRRNQRTTDKLIMVMNIRGQTAFGNLGSPEKFQLGGPTGVRAYPGGEASGDSGYIGTLEGQYNIGSVAKLGNLQLITFYDWGHIRQYHTASNLLMTTPNSYHLHGYGIGVKISSKDQYDVSLTWARRTGKNPTRDPVTANDSDGSHDLDRFWMTALYQF